MRKSLHASIIAALLLTTVSWAVSPGLAVALRGEGTMLVRQSDDCSGSGSDSTVTIPFSLFFVGFEPKETGTIVAFTQPGGEKVGEATVTVGPDGSLCVRVTGTAPAGQYKIVYDFGSGTGKQKVIEIVGPAPPTDTSTPSTTTDTPTPTISTITPTPTTTTVTPTPTTTTVTPTPSTTTDTPTPTISTITATPTTITVTPTPSTITVTPTPAISTVTPTPRQSTRVGHLKFTALPIEGGASAQPTTQGLPDTGGSDLTALVIIGSTLIAGGLLLVGALKQLRSGSR